MGGGIATLFKQKQDFYINGKTLLINFKNYEMVQLNIKHPLNYEIHQNLVVSSYNKKYEIVYNNKTNIDFDSINNNPQNFASSFINYINNELYNVNDVFIFDSKIFDIYNLAHYNINQERIILVDATEENKTMDTVIKIINRFEMVKLTKKNKIIIIGGGIIQDIAGFAATIYKRGIKWIYIPTTLLSMCDSCLGGKLCLNKDKTKNLLSIYNTPNKIIIIPDFLLSLPRNDIYSGIGEIYKLLLISNVSFRGIDVFSFNDSISFIKDIGLKENQELINYINYYTELIIMSNVIKKTIIEIDEFDKVERRILNYGHTFGHAIEKATDYFIPHGIAVLYGMYIVNYLFSKDLDKINENILDLIPDKYRFEDGSFPKKDNKPNIFPNFSIDDIFNSILNDKKNTSNNMVTFIILKKPGETFAQEYELTYELKTKIYCIFIRLGFIHHIDYFYKNNSSYFLIPIKNGNMQENIVHYANSNKDLQNNYVNSYLSENTNSNTNSNTPNKTLQ